jgi:septal ring factor EnvC (AmiA/AmiB activator)
LKTAAQAIAKANPGIEPRVLVEALTAALPYLNAEAKQAVAEMRQQMQQDVLSLRKDTLDQRESQFQQREDRMRDENDAKQKRFDTKEARLEAKQTIQQDEKVQELALKQKGLEHKIASGDKSATMKQWRDIADAKRKAALAAASIYSVNNGMDDKQKAKLAKEVNDSAEEEIANMRNMQGSSTPTGGMAPAGGGKTDARAGDQPKPIPTEIRGQYDAFVKEHPELRDKAIEKLKADGYTVDGL